jgi:hypothetical protein
MAKTAIKRRIFQGRREHQKERSRIIKSSFFNSGDDPFVQRNSVAAKGVYTEVK